MTHRFPYQYEFSIVAHQLYYYNYNEEIYESTHADGWFASGAYSVRNRCYKLQVVKFYLPAQPPPLTTNILCNLYNVDRS